MHYVVNTSSKRFKLLYKELVVFHLLNAKFAIVSGNTGRRQFIRRIKIFYVNLSN